MKDNIYVVPIAIIIAIIPTIFLIYILFTVCYFFMEYFIGISDSILAALNTSANSWDSFLPILIAFYVGILSFMIPIGIQMISTIRKDFPTEQIEQRFKNEFTFKHLPLILIVQIAFVGSFELLRNGNNKYPVILFFILSSMLWVSYLVYRHIKRLIDYTNKELVINWLIEDTNKYILQEKDVDKSIVSLRSLTDILVEEINKTPNYDHVNKLIDKVKEFSISFIPNTDSYNNTVSQNNEKYFKEISKSIGKVTKKSLVIENNDITDKIRHSIYEITQNIISSKNNQLYLEQLFNVHSGLFYFCLENNNSYQHSFGYHWYSDHLFKWYDKKYIFDIDYLTQFDNQQFHYIKHIIDENKYKVFQGVISWFHHGIGFTHNRPNLYGYDSKNRRDNFRLISKLNDMSRSIKSVEELDNFLKEFKALEDAVKQSCETDQERKEVEDKTNEIISYCYQQFLFNNLKNMVFGISTYCLYKQKYAYVKTIWEFKDPQDSTTIWVGHDIYPKSLGELIDFLIINTRKFDRKFSFRDEHHESDYYEKQLELYLLGYTLDQSEFNPNGKYLSNKNQDQLTSIKHYVEKLEVVVENIYISNNLEIFEKLGFKNITVEKISEIKEHIKTLFNNLKSECISRVENFERINELSHTKIEEFKGELVKGINDSSQIKTLIDYYNLYTQADEVNTDSLLGIKQLYPRPMFFDDWISNYMGIEHGLSASLVNGENKFIVDKLMSNSQEISGDDVEQTLDKFDDIENIFMLNINHSAYFDTNKYFVDKYKLSHNKQEEYPDFYDGYLEYKNIHIPIFEFYIQGIEECVLILNKTKFIKYIQYKPDDENIFENYLINIIDIKDLTEVEIKKEINFDGVPAEEEQEKINEYRKDVIIEFYESFKVDIDDNFEGFVFNIEEEQHYE